MAIHLRTSIDAVAWNAFVKSHPAGSIYHTTSWAQCVAEAFGIRVFWLTIEDPGGEIAGGLPLGLVSSPLFGRRLSAFPCAQYCGPLVTRDRDMGELLQALSWHKIRRLAGVAEVRVRRDPSIQSDHRSSQWRFCTHDVDLSPREDQLLRSFHKSCIQRPLSGMHRSGLTLRTGQSETEIKWLYRLYVSMRKSKGLFPAPFRFFDAIRGTLMQNGGGEILHAVWEHRIVSSILILYFGSTAIYEYGATGVEALSLHPNQFLLWEAMKRAKSRGCTVFNLGRTGRDNPGLIQYKQRWGASLVPLGCLYPGGAANHEGSERTALAILMKGTVRLMPRLACVYIGDVLYGLTI